MKPRTIKMSAQVFDIIFCCAVWLVATNGWGQDQSAPATKTIVGDLLMIDRDLYIVRGERGEIQIEATHKTEITEEFGFGDRIKALVLMNNKALKIERAGPNDVNGVVENRLAVAQGPRSPMPEKEQKKAPAKSAKSDMPPSQPRQGDRKTVIGDLLMIDRDLYIVRGERGEIQIEATHKTEITEEFGFGDRIKALVLMNNKALKIERAGPNDVSGVVVHGGTAVPDPDEVRTQPQTESPLAEQTKEEQKAKPGSAPAETRVVEGQILMVDGPFYVLRGERGEIRVERTDETKATEKFKFGDFIRATLTPTDKALTIERLK